MSTIDLSVFEKGLTADTWRRLKFAGRLTSCAAGATAGIAALSAGLLMRQAATARRIIPMAEAPPPRGDGVYGAKFGGKPLSMVILGDSTAAGYGVHRPRETPGALFATGTPWVSRASRKSCSAAIGRA